MSSESLLTECEDWMQDLGVKLVCVTFVTGEHVLKTEQHVDDLETLEMSVRRSLERMVWSYAIYPYMGRWVLVSRRRGAPSTRYYDSKEAAEMVAIHGG